MRPKGAKAEKEDLVQQAHQAASEAFIEKYRVKGGNTYDPKTRKVQVLVDWGGVPERDLKVRDLEKDGVTMLVDSFMNGIRMPMEIIGVIWVDGTTTLIEIDNFIVDLSNANFLRFIHIICGLHRTTALQRCHKNYPDKSLYKYLYLTLLIVPRTAANIQTILFIGNSDNRKSQILVRTSQWSVVAQYRRQLDRIRADTTLSASEQITAFTAYKQLTAPEIPFEKNTLHTFSAVASVDKAVFRLMKKIFTGEFVPNKLLKGQKKPEAVTHFTCMSGIPPKSLCEWLQRVVDGVWLTSQFMKRCKIYTKNERVCGQILEYMQTKRSSFFFSSIADVAKVYPAVVNNVWIDAVVSSCEEAVKAKLSAHATKMIDDMITAQELSDKESKVCSMCCLFVCVLIASSMFTSTNRSNTLLYL